MASLVTGATGFIGKHLLDRLLSRDEPVLALVRDSGRERLLELTETRWQHARSRPEALFGDITRPLCGVDERDVRALRGRVRDFFHLAALYDMEADEAAARAANVEGTRNALSLAEALGARFHYVSSVAVAGDHRGLFREDHFDEGQQLRHPYFKTKFEAEALVRREAKVPYRIYRPGVVIGSSKTGEADKIDGPYYAFKLIQRVRSILPQWFPLLGLEGGRIPLVPVDFVAAALDCISHKDGLDGRTFHLVDPHALHAGEVMNELCRAAHAPTFSARLDRRVTALVPTQMLGLVGQLPAAQTLKREVLHELGLPESVLGMYQWPAKFDAREAEAILQPAGIRCPPLHSYAWKIWDYWERHMDPDLTRDRSIAGALRGKRVLITGASSGIGRAIALKVASSGGVPLLVARSRDKLEAVRAEAAERGANAFVYTCDLSSMSDCDNLLERLRADGPVDILINNAGRSIRRSVSQSYQRFHDFERTMALNYFGALKITLGLLEPMRARKAGHIINVSSVGVQTNTPRFSAYVASKAALDAFSRVCASEALEDNVHFTTVYMPLVRTPMIAPTKIYDAFPALTPEQAADLALGALVTREKHVSTKLGTFGTLAYALAPRFVDRFLSISYRMFPESTGAERHDHEAEQQGLTAEGVMVAHVMKGIHW